MTDTTQTAQLDPTLVQVGSSGQVLDLPDLNDDDADTGEDASGKPTIDVDVVLNDLEMLANDFSDQVQQLRLMQENGFFRYASKECRNKMLKEMLDNAAQLDETARIAQRALKRVKRERVPDSLVDGLLVSAVLPGRL